ncbi:MAG: hypothetical protein BWY92_00999 [Firmicutes bacterium ADurb.BinA052]|nr:MAG: hypothetical protein BWY92_00999 [Firmicutes bacterium ADurb.BinA052]
MIVAMTFPPMAGLVCRSSLSLSSTSSPVQSAVSPALSFAATCGIRVLPEVVAAAKTISGRIWSIRAASSAE